MRNLPALSAVVAALVGCAPAQHSPPALADNWVDQQIALSATSLSLAQQRVHQTAPVPKQPLPAVPVESAKGPSTTVYTPNPVVAFTPAPGSTPVKPAAPSVMLPVSEKTVPQAPPGLPAVASAPAVPVTMTAATAAAVALGSVGAKPASVPLAKADPVPGKPLTPVTTTPAPAMLAPVVPSGPPVIVTPAPKPVKSWQVSPQDKTIRETLAKWATTEGWTFNPLGRDYWTVPQDFDVVATETFHGDFKDAVRKLIASTELTSTPLQPCFFNNKAVRVIRTTEECSPQASQGRKS